MSSTSGDIPGLVAHLFRRQAGQLTATISRLLGSSQIELAEDVVQETLLRALKTWPYHGVPENPAGWLTTTAKRIALDKLRHVRVQKRMSADLGRQIEETMSRFAVSPDPKFNAELRDDMLALMFACCRCDKSETTQIAMILHLLCGFSAREIANLFFVEESAMAQRLVRAKRALRESGLPLEAPLEREIGLYLDTVLAALYGLFNEGYKATSGDRLVREELCDEAIRLAELLSEHPAVESSEIPALMALFFFQHSRLAARVDKDGGLLTLEEQDRSRWDRESISRGFAYLDRAVSPDLSRYHLEAVIASCHAGARSYSETPWNQLLELYDVLMFVDPSPMVRLNRVVVLAEAKGVEVAIATLEELGRESSLAKHHLFHATRGEMLRRVGKEEGAQVALERAIELCDNDVERGFLLRKLAK
jgi:RNA polymerase sigma-70 factor (ECF subfamily)